MLLFLLLNFSVSAAVLYYAGWSQLMTKLTAVYPQGKITDMMDLIYWRMFLGFVPVAIFAVISAILFSHKITGPLVRIKKCLRRISEGDRNFALKLRKHDELKDLADEINALAHKLKK